jgi:hypothetical protein
MIQKREIGLAILFTILTCGIYGIYWFVKITNEARLLSGDDSMSGEMALLYTILTCGIYKFYWSYKMGKMMYKAYEGCGRVPTDNSVLYLILSIFQLDIVSYIIIQSELNSLAY